MVALVATSETELPDILKILVAKFIYGTYSLILTTEHIFSPNIHPLICMSLLFMIATLHFSKILGSLGRNRYTRAQKNEKCTESVWFHI
jgi:hypothetical protein